MATPAPAAKKARAQLTGMFPARNQASDGIMPSAAHTKANPKSDHELGNAVDLTRDDRYFDSWKLATGLISDPRTNYVIHRRKIWSRVKPYWRAYLGTNSHNGHVHTSILAAKRGDVSDWAAIAALSAPVVVVPPAPATPSPSRRVVTATHLNLRAKAMGKVLHVLSKGDVLTLISAGAVWTKVTYGGHTGVVATRYIRKG
jgi:uncharacterized protein YgiM (DUF1202 family)